MIVFKTYMKIIKSNITLVSLYTVIFLIIAVIMVNVNSSNGSSSFNETKVKVEIENNDKDSVLLKGLTDIISEKNEVIQLDQGKESIQDALFFRKVEYIVKIPNNFTDDFFAGKDVNLEKIQIDQSFSAYYMDNLINKYLDNWKIYKENNTNLTNDQILVKVTNDLKNDTKTTLYDSSNDTSILESMAYYFNMTAYALLGTILLGISICMSELNKDKISKRNLCSPVKPRTISSNIILGNFILSFSVYLIMLVAGIIFYKDQMFTGYGLLMMLNLFIVTICCMFIGMIIGLIVKARAAISAFCTTISLGLCFISGVFIPQMFIGESVKFIASFNPVYWFVKNNNDIINIINFDFESLRQVFISYSIQIAFAVCMLTIYLVMNKQKGKRAQG